MEAVFRAQCLRIFSVASGHFPPEKKARSWLEATGKIRKHSARNTASTFHCFSGFSVGTGPYALTWVYKNNPVLKGLMRYGIFLTKKPSLQH
jgi:hypothetical protein